MSGTEQCKTRWRSSQTWKTCEKAWISTLVVEIFATSNPNITKTPHTFLEYLKKQLGKKSILQTTKRFCTPHESLFWMKETSQCIYDECCSCRLVANGPIQQLRPAKAWQQPKTCFPAWHMHPNPHGPERDTICGQRAAVQLKLHVLNGLRIWTCVRAGTRRSTRQQFSHAK